MTKLTDLGMFTTLAATVLVAFAAFGSFEHSVSHETRAAAPAPQAVVAATDKVELTQDGRMKLTVTAERPRNS